MRATEVLHITYGQYSLEDGGIPVPEPSDDPDRILQPGLPPDNGARIATGTFWGPVEVTVEVLDTAPLPAQGDEWERVEEATLTAVGDLIGITPLEDDPPDLPELTVKPGERYHVRVSVRGYSAGLERPQYDTGEPPTEFHLVQLWPET